MNKYKEILLDQFEKIDSTEENNIKKGALLIKECIKNKGFIYIFGCGHSGLVAQDQFFRAGGFANVVPIMYEPLMLHISASNSSRLEKLNDEYLNFITNYKFTENDVFILISTSGKNAVPIEVAKYIKTKTTSKLITISSHNYIKLNDELISKYGDININNHCVVGDAVIFNEQLNIYSSPTSTLNSVYVINQLFLQSIIDCQKENILVDIFQSGNIESNFKNNEKLLLKYKNNIKGL